MIRDITRQQIKKLIGDKCIICNGNKWIEYHEINGIDHHNRNPSYYLRHYKDFIPICHEHHRALHNLKLIAEDKLKLFLELLSKLKSKPL